MRYGVSVLVLFPVGTRCCLVGPPPDVAQGPLLESLLGYPPLEVVWGTSVVAALK